uniref:Uncharacterized protein n=1 Tax=Aegilops tauschii subsp. strangulata TaxID=200361 RepID=A0A453HG75_AEGTS
AAFQSDELLLHDDDEFEGTRVSSTPSPRPPSTPPVVSSRRRSADATQAAGASESNTAQFTLEHDLGAGLGFAPAGSFSARLKSSAHGSQTLTKLRFTRNELTEDEKNAFKVLSFLHYFLISLFFCIPTYLALLHFNFIIAEIT